MTYWMLPLSAIQGSSFLFLTVWFQAEMQEVSDRMRQLMGDINAINQQGCGVSAEVDNLRREIFGGFLAQGLLL